MINILFNIDKNYFRQCKAVIRSILAHTKSDVRFYIVGGQKREFEAFNCVCLNVPDISIIKRKTNYRHITTAACYRLFAPDLLPDIDKVIYLDADIIVRGDISELWNFDVKYIAGVQDPLYKRQAKKNNLRHLYINSGVLVLNLKNLRNIDYYKRIEATQTGLYNLSLLDQDIINIAFGDIIEHLPLEWNVYSKLYPETTYDMIEARNNPKIIHWCGHEKPWNADVWMKDEWSKYDD